MEDQHRRLVPTAITLSRGLCSVLLLYIEPLSMAYLAVYAFCGLSDMIDGYIARRTGSISKTGAVLDSLADALLMAIVLYTLIPVIKLQKWMIIWAAATAFIKLVSISVFAVRFREFCMLHTYANKGVGLLLFAFPFLCRAVDINICAVGLCAAASAACAEELYIAFSAKSINRDIKSIFTGNGGE